MGTDIYHKAARDGYVDLLREATRKDADRPDEDGMTPTLWAAFHGNMDALRMLILRGGNPDKCDLLGNTALHCAAANGHLHVVNYLVSLSSNMWALDNDFHTPLDVAVLNNHNDIVRFLDDMSFQQVSLNKKVVQKMKEKAVLEAHKRIKKYEKLQQKAQKRAEKDQKLMAKERLKMQQNGRLIEDTTVYVSGNPNGHVQNGTLNGNGTLGRRSTFSSSNGGSGTLSRNGSIVSSRAKFDEPQPFSAYVNNNTGKKGGMLTGVAKRIKQQRRQQYNDGGGEFKVGEVEIDGTRTIRSLSGLQRDHHVMYVRSNTQDSSKPNGNSPDADTISRALSEPDFNYSNDSANEGSSGSTGGTEAASMFERPGFGNVAFINRKITSGALLSLPSESTDIDSISVVTNGVADDNDHTITTSRVVKRRGSLTDSIGTVGSLAARMRRLPFGNDLDHADDLDDLDDDVIEPSQLELFLSAHRLTDYLQIFTREQIDLPALMLLSDEDLKEIGLPMGPRRKLMDAILRRKKTLANPGIVMDTLL